MVKSFGRAELCHSGNESHTLGTVEPQVARVLGNLVPSVLEETTKGDASKLILEMSMMSSTETHTHTHTHTHTAKLVHCKDGSRVGLPQSEAIIMLL